MKRLAIMVAAILAPAVALVALLGASPAGGGEAVAVVGVRLFDGERVVPEASKGRSRRSKPAPTGSPTCSTTVRTIPPSPRWRPIAPGLRADLLLVEGDPASDVLATRAIDRFWKGGREVEREPAATGAAPGTAVRPTGLDSDFDDGTMAAAYGAGWRAPPTR